MDHWWGFSLEADINRIAVMKDLPACWEVSLFQLEAAEEREGKQIQAPLPSFTEHEVKWRHKPFPSVSTVYFEKKMLCSIHKFNN